MAGAPRRPEVPDSPVYRVRWGSKELKDWGALVRGVLLKGGGAVATKGVAALATKSGARILGSSVGSAFLAGDLAKNPWHLAKNRADKTGVIVGDLIGRTEAESYVLMGHSLGARLMVVAAEALGTKPGGPRIESMHLFGAAIGARSNWDSLTAAVDEAVYGYHSTHDKVLKIIYKTIQVGQSAAGCVGFSPASTKLVNVDVSETVKTHFDYQGTVQLR